MLKQMQYIFAVNIGTLSSSLYTLVEGKMMAEDLFPEKDNAYRMAVDGIKVQDDNRTAVGQVKIIRPH